ncbi:TetR/AcrR family transcriptional regulator [Spiribacter halobius]|uniref:TetR/AcrR family transcriptional regulator n=1 Tax=Sediminicurvatus halobius TaxID=2182432 RepID=A0A2U2MXE0_9GAMM|nr:TetR/AcrR family transcriptional regulator [Spiribacter halobius]PWG61538.1 TetR/AcrR family transcriptional regulator [Spiribacter halobius]UEX78018.1 TetR/AcrR family transcriptional regulator [Spiribacter halobius]
MGKAQGRQRSDADTRERLLRVAAELFAANGYHATGMKELEKATGLGRSSLYYQFSSKEEMLFEIVTRYLRELIDYGNDLMSRDMGAEERLRLLSRGVMRTIARDLPELTVCFREVHAIGESRRGELMDLHRRYEQVWTDVLEVGVRDGVFRTSSAVAVKALLGMHHYSYLWFRPDGPRSPEEVADAFVDLFLNGLLQRPLT